MSRFLHAKHGGLLNVLYALLVIYWTLGLCTLQTSSAEVSTSDGNLNNLIFFNHHESELKICECHMRQNFQPKMTRIDI